MYISLFGLSTRKPLSLGKAANLIAMDVPMAYS